ncbi:hypothetical protein CDES_00145 [Corynebacterium deserti GIMN1.010]|uniref:Uncharacterized protein n=1 Tax=Corynebacterium deserti GIMN1.010 TaxID=931089 RepID=A0A0M4CMF3_9CORY|nr:hypothetical protein [Corynebacterium deserti]ALC04517.1 hypothetical protein CDES_00145 [Corynebacterium deserti GIMN1.010]
MSTIGNVKLALDGARKAYDAYADYRDRKVSETYDALSQAAETYAPKAEHAVESAVGSAREFYSESRDKAGSVTKAARARLEKALADAEKQGVVALKDAEKSGKKLNRKARRKAEKAQKSAQKAAQKATGKKESHWVRNLSLAALAASGVAALAYAVLNKSKKDAPGTEPPRVEVQLKNAVAQDEPEVEEDAPKLVYSTTTPEGETVSAAEPEVAADAVDAAAEKIAEDVAENVSEQSSDAAEAATDTADDSADEAAEAIQADFDKKNAPQRDQSNKK